MGSTLRSSCADASGWPALPVEYFERIITAVNVEAVDLSASRRGTFDQATFDVSNPASVADIDGPFSITRRTVSVEAIDRPKLHVSGSTPEHYNLPNLGLFLWRTPALPIVSTDPGAIPSGEYLTFHPAGIDTPLLQLPEDRTSPWSSPSARSVPLWISRLMLSAWTDAWREADAHPPGLGFSIIVDGTPIKPSAIYVPARPTEGSLIDGLDVVPGDDLFAVVDPERGRFSLGGPGLQAGAAVTLDWSWGQPGWIGGGPYDREYTMRTPADGALVILVSSRFPTERGRDVPIFTTLGAALEYLARRLRDAGDSPLAPAPRDVLIRILDSASYEAPGELDLPDLTTVTIQALDGQRPAILAGPSGASLRLVTPGDAHATVELSGLLLAGALDVRGDFDLRLVDTTVVPSAPVRWVRARSGPSFDSTLDIRRSITGPLVLDEAMEVDITESIVDGHGGLAIRGPSGQLGPPLRLTAVTVLGSVHAAALDEARDVVVTGSVRALRLGREVLRDARISLELVAPAGSGRGQRDVVWSRPWRWPASPFNSTRYGDPGYGQLRLDAGDELLRGGTGGTELGAYRSLASGQRLANLQPVLADYTPFGLDVGVFIMGQVNMPFSIDRSGSSDRRSPPQEAR